MRSASLMDTTHSKRIGILGGTFNPPHLGHMILAQDAAEAFQLDHVWFLPCAQPAHKPYTIVAAAEHRVNMVKLCMGNDPRWQCSLLEIERAGVSYTIDTLQAVTQQRPDVDWHFIVGADTLLELHSWRNIEAVLSLCWMIAMRRPGLPGADALRNQIQLPAPWPDVLIEGLFEGHLIDVSSTEIRKRVAQKRSIRYLVPAEVEQYILAHELYCQGHNEGDVSSKP